MRKTLRVTKVDFHNEYMEVPFIPPSAKPISDDHRVGDYVEMSSHGYIRARYRKEEPKHDFSKISSPVLLGGFSD